MQLDALVIMCHIDWYNFNSKVTVKTNVQGYKM